MIWAKLKSGKLKLKGKTRKQQEEMLKTVRELKMKSISLIKGYEVLKEEEEEEEEQ